MFKHKKIWFFIFIILAMVVLYFIFFYRKNNQTNCFPQITLKGNKIISLKISEKYKEIGYKVKDKCDKSVKVKIDNNINYDTPGTYEIIYTATNKHNKKVTEKRYVNISVNSNFKYKDNYDLIDNKIIGWGIKNKKDKKRPEEVNKLNDQLLKYNTYFIGNDEKKLYLTFDEGSNDTYLKEILDVLNNNDVKGTFFFCKRYILDNKEVMNKLVKYGHSVGNHTANHYTMPNYANKGSFQKFLNEIIAVEEAFEKTTGIPMDKIYREPRGEYSIRDLQILKDIGYKTYFWSIAYMDYENNISKEKAFNELISRVHNGAIYLIHPKNRGNYEALDSFIKQMKKEGYIFDLVKNIK